MSANGKWVIFFGEDWGRHHSTGQYLAKELAKEYKVLWINSLGMRAPKFNIHDISRIFQKLFDFIGSRFKKQADDPQENIANIEVLAPLAIPLLHSNLVRAFNKVFVLRLIKSAMERYKISEPVVITACPASVDLLDELGAKLKVYYCADEYSVIHGMDKELVHSLESELLDKVDVVAATAKMLVKTKSQQHDNVHYLPHGVDYELFQQANSETHDKPSDIAHLNVPMIGFVGLIGEHIDMGIISHLSATHKNAQIVMIGPVEDGTVTAEAENILYLGEKDRDDLPRYLAHFNACIIPYKQTERNKYANPTKLNEYLAAGCPVVTMPHPEVHEQDVGIYVAKNQESFSECISCAIKTTAAERSRISNNMATSTWQHRTQCLLEIVKSLPTKP